MIGLDAIKKREGWETTERDGYLHFETTKGLLSQGFSYEQEAILAYEGKLILWRYVRRGQLSNLRMAAGGENRINKVIVDGVLKEWVGIGWTGDEPPTPEERRRYPLCIDREEESHD